MAISENAFVRLDYTGRVKETGNVFDTTSEDVAEEANIKNPEKDYHPMVLAVGSSQLIPKLHEEIQKLDVGQKQTVEIPCEDAFGKRDPSLIRLIPMKEFKKQGIKPFVGMPLTLEGNPGIVRTVDGGRVRVDFNHELAGKDIVYDLEIIEEITDNEEKMIETVSSMFAKTIVVLNVGGMVETEWLKQNQGVGAVLLAWNGGMEGGLAEAELILGLANPSGKLSDTFARRLEDYPSADTFYDSDDYVDYFDLCRIPVFRDHPRSSGKSGLSVRLRSVLYKF